MRMEIHVDGIRQDLQAAATEAIQGRMGDIGPAAALPRCDPPPCQPCQRDRCDVVDCCGLLFNEALREIHRLRADGFDELRLVALTLHEDQAQARQRDPRRLRHGEDGRVGDLLAARRLSYAGDRGVEDRGD